MGSDDRMVDEFFAEVNDKYYPQILEGLEMLDTGNVEQGIDILARPLHTIKGVTGFMTGFSEASEFTHKVEDFLKLLHSGKAEHSDENLVLAAQGVNTVFTVLELIRDTGKSDQESADLLDKLKRVSAQKTETKSSSKNLLRIEQTKDVTVIRVEADRFHLKSDRQTLSKALDQALNNGSVLLDLSHTLTFNSASWEIVTSHAKSRRIAATGLSPACKEVFFSWGFDLAINYFPDEASFWRTHEENRDQNQVAGQ